jgi:hypothetical protein
MAHKLLTAHIGIACKVRWLTLFMGLILGMALQKYYPIGKIIKQAFRILPPTVYIQLQWVKPPDQVRLEQALQTLFEIANSQ